MPSKISIAATPFIIVLLVCAQAYIYIFLALARFFIHEITWQRRRVGT